MEEVEGSKLEQIILSSNRKQEWVYKNESRAARVDSY